MTKTDPGRACIFMAVYGEVDFDARVQRCATALAATAAIDLFAIDSGRAFALPGCRMIPYRPELFRKPGLVRFFLFAMHMVQAARHARPNVVYVHDYFLALPGWLAARLTAARFVYDAHELMVPSPSYPLERRERAFHRAEACVAGRADLIIATTPERAEVMQDHYRLTRPPVVVRNIDPAPLRPPEPRRVRDEVAALAALAERRFVIVYAGAVAHERRLDLMIRALAQLSDDTAFAIVGGGPDEQRLANLAADLGVSARVVLTGQVPRTALHDILGFAGIGFICYSAETLNTLNPAPNKVFEYAHAGLPILSSAQPALVELVELSGIGELFAYVRLGDDEDRAVADIAAKVVRMRDVPGRYRNRQAVFLSEHNWLGERNRLVAALEPLLAA